MHVLIATVTAGGGHLAAAAAIEEAWKTLRPEDSVELLDVLKFFSPLHRKIYVNGYVQLVGRAPELWGLMFDKTDNLKVVRRMNKLKQAFPSRSRTRFERHVVETGPEAVLCTHFLPLELLGNLRHKKNGPRPFTVSIVTDFEAHALWMEPCVDLYCVAAEATKARLVARGAAAEEVVVTGIPVGAKFSSEPDEEAVRKARGLRDDLPVLLVLSGGFGMGPVAEMVEQLDKAERAFQILVVTGRNEELRRELAAQDRRHPTQVIGFASNMHELMAVSDLVITKPGGLTSSEALAMGKPLLILNPIPGQEAANSDFLLEHSAAAKANRMEDLPYRIEELLGSKRLARMAQASKRLGRPDAARAVCRETLKRMEAEQA
jgi:processive 1,2-diacylglycerol beta-glucosyltransferase